MDEKDVTVKFRLDLTMLDNVDDVDDNEKDYDGSRSA